MAWPGKARRGKARNILKEYRKTKACVTCAGECCKILPGSYSPADICRLFPAKTLLESIKKAIAGGKVCIDWWVMDDGDDLYFLRPATKQQRSSLMGDMSGVCIHLASYGCELPAKKRPLYCRLLRPRTAKEKNCTYDFKESPKMKSALEWKDTALYEFMENIGEKDI